MKKFSILCCLFFFSFAPLANATTITFWGGLDSFFSYSNVAHMTSPASNNGYASVQAYTSSTNIVRNGIWGNPKSSFTMSSPGTFDLTSFVIAGAFGSQTITVEGLRDSSTLYTKLLNINTTAQLFSPTGWNGIDQFNIILGNNFENTGGGIGPMWALDDIVLTENVGTNPVPEPATMLLFGVGLLGLTGIYRRKK